MRVAIITFQDAINYGAVLQAHALKAAVEKRGVTCDVINYYNEYFHKKQTRSIKSIIKTFLHAGAYRRKGKNFSKFLDEFVTQNKPVVYNDDLSGLNNLYDLFITGSDQVWNLNCSGNKKAYFLDFVSDNSKKCSYAASFGGDKIVDTELIKSLLGSFKKISVREESGRILINELLKITVPVVLDPVFLLDSNYWNRLKVQSIKRKYIFVYEVVNGFNIERYAKELSAQTGLPIVFITSSNKIRFGMRVIRDAGPREWITLLSESEYVITNSFHGLAFALLYNKQFFIELLPNGNLTNARITELLDRLNLKDRIIENGFDLTSSIDYAVVMQIIEKLKDASNGYLSSIIGK